MDSKRRVDRVFQFPVGGRMGESAASRLNKILFFLLNIRLNNVFNSMRKSPISLFFSLLRSAIMESLSWLYSFRTSVDRLPKKDTWRRRCDRFELESIYSPFLSFSSLARSRHRLYYRYRIQQLFIFPFCTFETETRLYRESFKLTSCHCRWQSWSSC